MGSSADEVNTVSMQTGGLPEDPMDVNTEKKTGKKRKAPIILGVVAAVAAVIVILALYLTTLSPAAKILKAAQNTFVTNPFIETLSLSDLPKGELGIDFSGEVKLSGITAEVDAVFNEEELDLAFPALSQVLRYGYTEEKSGAVAQTPEGGEMMANMDKIFSSVYSLLNKKTEAVSASQLLAAAHSFRFKKIDRRTFTIGDEEVTLPGYSTQLSAELTQQLLSSVNLDGLSGLGEGTAQLVEWIQGTEEPVIEVYLYEDRLGALGILREDGQEMLITFAGGYVPYANAALSLYTGAADPALTYTLSGTSTGETTDFALALTKDGGTVQVAVGDLAGKVLTFSMYPEDEEKVWAVTATVEKGGDMMTFSDLTLTRSSQHIEDDMTSLLRLTELAGTARIARQDTLLETGDVTLDVGQADTETLGRFLASLALTAIGSLFG